LEGAHSFLHSGSDIVAETETGDEISDNEVLITLEWLVLFACTLALLHALVDIFHRPTGALVVFF
jgi:hypothetical protein